MAPGGTRVLVTGGAGFIGSALTRALCAAGHPVRVLDDFSTGRRERLAGLPVEVLAADVRNPRAVRRAVEGAPIIFHLAGVRVPGPGSGDVLRAQEVNVGGAVNVLDAATEVRARRVVLVSSGAVYGRSDAYVLQEERAVQPCTAEAVQQLAIESYAQVYHLSRGVPTVTLRLFRVFGPGEPWEGEDVPLVPHLCRVALEGAPRLLRGDGSQTRDFVYLDNAVGGLLAAASARGVEGRVYNIASGEAVSVASVWEQLALVAGVDPESVPTRRLPLPAWEPSQVRVSIARARRDLGYLPSVLLRDALRRTFVHFREQLRATQNGWFMPAEAPEAPSPRPAPTPIAVIGPRTLRQPPPPPAIARRPPPPPPPARLESEELIESVDLVDVIEDLNVDPALAPVPAHGRQ